MMFFRRKLTPSAHAKHRHEGAAEGAEYHRQAALDKRDIAAWALAQAEGHALMEAVYRKRMEEIEHEPKAS